MLKEFMFTGEIVLNITQKRLFTGKLKTSKRKFDYCDIIYAKDLPTAKEKMYNIVEKFVEAQYKVPVKWNGIAATDFRVQGSLSFADARRVLEIEFVKFENMVISTKDISDWTVSKCKRNMTPQEYAEHCGLGKISRSA